MCQNCQPTKLDQHFACKPCIDSHPFHTIFGWFIQYHSIKNPKFKKILFRYVTCVFCSKRKFHISFIPSFFYIYIFHLCVSRTCVIPLKKKKNSAFAKVLLCEDNKKKKFFFFFFHFLFKKSVFTVFLYLNLSLIQHIYTISLGHIILSRKKKIIIVKSVNCMSLIYATHVYLISLVLLKLLEEYTFSITRAKTVDRTTTKITHIIYILKCQWSWRIRSELSFIVHVSHD